MYKLYKQCKNLIKSSKHNIQKIVARFYMAFLVPCCAHFCRHFCVDSRDFCDFCVDCLDCEASKYAFVARRKRFFIYSFICKFLAKHTKHFFKCFVFVALVFASLHTATAKTHTLNWDDLEDTQKALLHKLWNVGEPFGLQYALIAISYTESRLGLYPLNLQTYDCGVLHINIKSYLRISKIKDSPLNRNIYCGNLIVNEDLSISAAIVVLQYFYNYWSKRHKNPMEYAIKSYNAGFNVHSKTAQQYYNKVSKNIKAVQALEKAGLLRQQRLSKTP